MFFSSRIASVRSTHRVLYARLSLAAVGAITATLLAGGVASAHVTVSPNTANADASTNFAVRVPNEKPESTISVKVEFPTGLTVSRFQPVAGWTRQVERDAQQRIISVTWTGSQIADLEYQDFPFVARTPKEAGPIYFKAYQTYQGAAGVVPWINVEGAENPAPKVTIGGPVVAAPAADSHGGASGGADTHAVASPVAAAAPAATTTAAASGGSDASLFVVVGSAVVALIALVIAGAALARKPQAA